MREFCRRWTYVQGLAFSYVLVGVAAGLTGNLLTVLPQQPAVILSAAALMVVFALAMFDVIAIPAAKSAWQSRLNDASGRLGGGRLASVFAMGALSALIIGPCVAPPLAVALGYIGASRDAWLGGVALYARPWACRRRCWWWALGGAGAAARRGVDEPGQGGVWRGDAGAGGVSGRALLPAGCRWCYGRHCPGLRAGAVAAGRRASARAGAGRRRSTGLTPGWAAPPPTAASRPQAGLSERGACQFRTVITQMCATPEDERNYRVEVGGSRSYKFFVA